MEEYGPDLITLLDEDGKEHSFEYLDTVECDDAEYVALMPVADEAADALADDGELVVLRIEEEDGEEVLVAIDDDDEFKKISALFVERLSELFDFDADEAADE